MLDSTPDLAPFASAGAIVADALDAYLPPDLINVADHAAKHRWLDNRGGGFVGRWSHDEAPYLIAPMEALTNPDYLTEVIPGPGRSGKTAVAENWMLQSVDADPADMLWYEPTDDLVEAYVKAVINPMIEQHDILKTRLGPNPIDRSIHFKSFRSGMWVQFLPMAENNLRNKSAPRIVVDEIDAMPESVGDVYEQADLRRQSFGRDSKILVISHPDQALGMEPAFWTRGVMALFARSTRCLWYWPCPDCNDFSSPHPMASRVMTVHYPETGPLDEIRDAAALLCPSCGSLIADKYRRVMNLDGKWVGLGQTIAPNGTVDGDLVRRDISGHHIVGAMSPFIIGGIGALAVAKVDAERKMTISGDDKPLRMVVARRWGLPYEPRKRIGQVDAITLADRAEERPLQQVPAGVRFLTAFVDIQANRFDLMVRGWGVDSESWIIDVQQIPADPAVSGNDWDDMLGRLIEAAYPLTDGTGRGLRIRAIGYDSAGATGVTQQAYAAWRRLRGKRTMKFLGKADGRDLFSVVPMKGASGPNAVRVQVVYPTSKRKDRDARATGAEPLALFNPNSFKDNLAGQLACAEPGPFYIHHPRCLRGEWPTQDGPETPETKHLWFNQVVAERADTKGNWIKISPNERNEALDQHVGCHVLADLHGLARIKWDRPPNWAAEWNTNVLVTPASNTPTGAGIRSVTSPLPAGATPSPASAPRNAASRLDRIAALMAR